MHEPVPTPEEWTFASFTYYHQNVSLVNIGGHKNGHDLREQYRHCPVAQKKFWLAYLGVWRVVVNGRMVLTTPSFQEAEERFSEYRRGFMASKKEQKGNELVRQFSEIFQASASK